MAEYMVARPLEILKASWPPRRLPPKDNAVHKGKFVIENADFDTFDKAIGIFDTPVHILNNCVECEY
jgi:hypothetical protein